MSEMRRRLLAGSVVVLAGAAGAGVVAATRAHGEPPPAARRETYDDTPDEIQPVDCHLTAVLEQARYAEIHQMEER